MGDQVRRLLLNDGEHLNTTLYRLQKGWKLHFVLGPSLQHLKVKVFCNHPPTTEKKFDRGEYYELPWQSYSKSKCDQSDNYCEVNLHRAGSFQYFFTYNEWQSATKNGSGYFIVDPTLYVGPEKDLLPLDCVCLQTVLAKSLGPYKHWEKRVQVARESGYNVLHFTPIQELGASNSSYSLRDQHALNPGFHHDGNKPTHDQVGEFVEKLNKEWHMLCITDVVWNHTSFDSPWLKKHPECAYNLANSPHLRPAYVLDRILWHFTLDLIDGKWEHKGLTKHINDDNHLHIIRSVLLHDILPQYKLSEFLQTNVDHQVEQFMQLATESTAHDEPDKEKVELVQDPKYQRLKSTVNMDKALAVFNIKRPEASTEEERVDLCCAAFRNHLHGLNAEADNKMREDLGKAVDNVICNVSYHYTQPHGPKLGTISLKHPVVPQYFTHPGEETDVFQEEAAINTDKASFVWAHNGWVMGDDPLRNFAEPGSSVYLRRELIAWGDSVKLRYGDGPKDCPFLWEHMLSYTRETARLFHGVRIDNCHSTQINVAEYMLDEARKVNPDLYVIAELFTQSEYVDNVFVNRLGINSLIREAQSAWDSHEEGRLVYRYGGEPVGSFLQPQIRPMVPSIAHALFMDLTHDNECPVQRRSVYDLFPSAAIVAMACCATGSNRGYDELVPHQIHVVDECRLYPSWNEEVPKGSTELVNQRSGIIAGKRALNYLHQSLGAADFNQVYVDQVDQDIVAITRHCPITHQSIILVARTAFTHPTNPHYTGHVPPLCIPGNLEEIILEGRLVQKKNSSFAKCDNYINGLDNYKLELQEHIQLFGSTMCELSDDGEINSPVQEVDFINFPPGSVIAFRVSLSPSARTAVSFMRSCITQFGFRMRSMSGNLRQNRSMDFQSIANKLTLSDLNRLLYRCDAEERDDGNGYGVYNIPDHGNLVYCGFQGVMSLLAKIRPNNDLGHPLCENLRQGDWLPGYIAKRLMFFKGTKDLGKWLEAVFKPLSQIPRYLIPCYFDAIMVGAYTILLDCAWKKMSNFVHEGSSFVRALALGSVQLCGSVKTSRMPQMSPVHKDLPMSINESTGRKEQCIVSMAAGLPHFSTGVMRCWGRDTFIALRGLLLVTGRFEEARNLILAFAGAIRHGMVPNLLGGGAHARFNARDATWFWLQCIQDYCNMVPEGTDILSMMVSRIFPEDDSEPQPPGFVDKPLVEVIQDVMQRHMQGIEFRERHAGPGLDRNMSDIGFNVKVGVDPNTGFVFGGSEHNCGTWMDKMGESDMAGTRGKPATPRDGSAVEIVGLCKSALRWLVSLYEKGLFPYDSVAKYSNGKPVKVTYKEWNSLIQENFEKHFWIASDVDKSVNKMVNKTGIYKDSVGATQFWADYQLRPNFPIAMVVAPELFTPENAWTAIGIAEKYLLGPVGMKTLDPDDWAYDGDYDNSYDGGDAKKARGFNYHQGPEWVWVIGYFLRAKLHFANMMEDQPEMLQNTIQFIQQTLSRHHVEIEKSPWRGLPELTNKNGTPCKDSCPTQAWSMSCILDALYDVHHVVSAKE
ncbi:glycogen debranching enzyme-like [Ptychodera flava]|uniref:glycogen debranching enzyme-like n=1 Tax=Ptychodera flava TaxID=63121 RepID=UPI00396A81C1